MVICEIDSSAGISRRAPPTEILHIPIFDHGRSILLSIDNQFYEFTPLNALVGETFAV